MTYGHSPIFILVYSTICILPYCTYWPSCGGLYRLFSVQHTPVDPMCGITPGFVEKNSFIAELELSIIGSCLWISVSCTKPITLFLNSLNLIPCSGLVKWSAIIPCVEQCFTVTSPHSTLSLMNNYCTLICLVRFVLDAIPFSSIKIATLLSWYRIDVFTLNPWHCKKHFVHIIWGDI